MNRRYFIGLVAAASAALQTVGIKAFEKLPKRRGFSIAQILAISFPAAKQEQLRRGPFHDHRLLKMYYDGNVSFIPLGEFVEENFADGSRKNYDIEQLAIPVTWTAEDELRNPTENNKISLVASLIDNMFDSHDDVLFEKVGDARRLLISKQYNYQLSETRQMTDENGKVFYHCYLYTAYCNIPKA